VCENTLLDLLKIPPRHFHRIGRALTHRPILGSRLSGEFLEGLLIMEFNGEVFQYEIRVTRGEVTSWDGKDLYSKKVMAGVRFISDAVMKRIEALDLERFDYDD